MINRMVSLREELERRRFFIPVAEGEMSVLRFGAEGAPPLLFAHANGFCASAYRQMFEALGDRFDIFGVDLRGYGATKLPADPRFHRGMDIFAKDICDLMTALARRFSIARKWRLAGHSLGGATMALAAPGRDDVADLRLIEPVAMSRSLALLAHTPVWPIIANRMPLVRAARGRRATWPDRTTVKASYSRKGFFSTWADGVLDDYLADGLRDDESGVGLSCAPAWEAATFAGQAHDFWGAIKTTKVSITVLAANHPATSTVPEASIRSLERRGVSVVRVTGLTHLIPQEDPVAAADFLAGD